MPRLHFHCHWATQLRLSLKKTYSSLSYLMNNYMINVKIGNITNLIGESSGVKSIQLKMSNYDDDYDRRGEGGGRGGYRTDYNDDRDDYRNDYSNRNDYSDNYNDRGDYRNDYNDDRNDYRNDYSSRNDYRDNYNDHYDNRDNPRGGNDYRNGYNDGNNYRGGVQDNYYHNDRGNWSHQDNGCEEFDTRRVYERDYLQALHNIVPQLDRMNLNRNGGGNNMYSQHSGGSYRAPQRCTAGMSNLGQLAGGADHPRMPVAKKDLAHNQQKFCERPESSAYDNPRCGKKIELLTNHALVHLPTTAIVLYEYNVEVFKGRKKLEKREEAGPMFREILQTVPDYIFPPATDFIYNDVNLIWSTTKLSSPEKKVGGGNGNWFYYKYTRCFELNSELAINCQDSQLVSTLVDAIATARARWPKQTGNKFSVFKKSIFLLQDRLDEGAFADASVFVKLRNGVDARIGFSMAIKLNLRVGITACFDVSHTLFTRPGYPLVRLFWELIHGETLENEQILDGEWDSHMQKATPTESNIQLMSSVLKKMTLIFSPEDGLSFDEEGKYHETDLRRLKSRGREFKFYQFGSNSSFVFFDERSGHEISVAEYFLAAYNYRLRYPNLPCLQKKPSKMNPHRIVLYPMELVSLLVDPMRYTGAVTEKLKGDLIKYTTLSVEQRRLVLQNVIAQKAIGDCPPIVDNEDRYMLNHGIKIGKEMLSVKACLLPAPEVVYGNSTFLDTENQGEWEAVTNDPIRTVLEDGLYMRTRNRSAPKLKKRLLGSILKIGSPMNSTGFEIDDSCYHHLMRAIHEAGQPVCWQNLELGQAVIQGSMEYLQGRDLPGTVMDWFNSLKENLDKYKQGEDEVIVPLVFVIFEVRFSTLNLERQGFQNDYNLFKFLADNEVGIFTQGMLKKTFNNIGATPATCKYTSQIVEKVLGKVGTTHRRLERNGDHKSWKKITAEPTLILGVDVSHPSPRDLRGEDHVKRLSIATVVGNIDLDCTEYRASSKIQDVGEERIVRFENEILERISGFVQFTGKRPAHIVIYRDGLSEGDFQRTLYEEKNSVQIACRSIAADFNPTLTYIVVTKRHHTRFFLKNEEEGSKEHGFNVLPGTLVEDTVTTKNYYDFFLSTQVGQIGLARPTHYYVLHNDWKVPGTFWPTVTHALTYLFCRSTSTVNLPAPVLYAHLAAKKAKETMDGALYANALCGKFLDTSSFADLAQLERCIKNHAELDGMTFV
ncbi:hypothetical protein B9Z55_028015 [Caenorhabditis nigoni]|uniref:Piwi domain-containing protein n=2 Tax=Caenorhabditis nigoni TaxID=1611254 RepID=A0A2G5SE76_9PELO|nr:hypothetical protein B9Z55_028015 [Caenorhabditis nigoni]